MKIEDNLKFKNKTIHVEISSYEFEIAMNAVEIASFELGSYFEQVETIKGKLNIADAEVQITIPTKMQIT